MRFSVFLALSLFCLFGCATPPHPGPPAAVANSAPLPSVDPYWNAPPKPVAYDSLPGWETANLAPGLNALRQSCRVFAARADQDFLSTKASWAGRAGDWKPACAALDVVKDEGSARAVLQALFTPVEIVADDGASRFTGYFEPAMEARLSPVLPFTEPIPAVPNDLVSEGADVFQRSAGGGMRPYPARAEITARGVTPIAYARPEDVFFLQIQGSGRLVFPDGRTIRAAYGAHNGHPFKSTANWLMARGWISRGEASMAGIKAWMARTSPQRRREAMNANPRFVFFVSETLTDPTLGPKGALSVPLTPMGSMAVDLDLHANGVPMFVNTTAPSLGGAYAGFVVAQDTGGAIKGAVRGDLYFGTGAAAGAAADQVNAPGRLWVLLPRAVAARLSQPQMAKASRFFAFAP